MLIQDVMTREPVGLPLEATIREALDLLREQDVRHVPILDEGSLVGMLSERDLHVPDFDREEIVWATVEDWLDAPVSALVSRDVVVLGPEAELKEAIDQLLEHRIGAIPVVDTELDQLVGILSYVDVLKQVRAFA